MKTSRILLTFGVALFLGAGAFVRAADGPKLRQWKVDGVTREALVYVPPHATTQTTPVIFAFHGHGGSMGAVANAWKYHTLWPEALVVYPQGLHTPGLILDAPGMRSGWQVAAGAQADRDLRFFDAMLVSLRHDYRVDDRRIYATGFSNGAVFTYLLWAERGDQFAAFAPVAGVDAVRVGQSVPRLKPKPVLHVAGEKDNTAKFAGQQRMIAAFREHNECGPGQQAPNGCVTYPSKVGAPVVTFIHPGGHEVPAAAPALIVAFFQEHPRASRTYESR